jgi:putative hemolysin
MMPKFLILPVLLAVVLASSGCVRTPPSNNPSNQTAMANPASVKCVNDGGQDKLVYGPDGQYGLCLFPDGSVCEEWAYFRGNCSKGECMRKCDFIGTRSEGWYDCHGNLLFWDTCANETAPTAGAC